jgi:transposase
MKKIAYVGVDYHVESLCIAVMIEGIKDFHETIHLKNNDAVIKKYLQKLSKDYNLKVCYEASGSGYVFQRKLKSWGYHCDVIAPSLIPKKAGDHRKNDFRDARILAQNYAAGLLTIVHPPTQEEESVRQLIRCRIALKQNVKQIKQQINGFLLSQGNYWGKKKWTGTHHSWLSKLQLLNAHVQQVLDTHMQHLEYLETCVERIDTDIETIAQSEVYAPSVKKLRAFRGIGTLSAMLLIAEITDFRRFASPGALMAFLGLVPSEHSSGTVRKAGAITKAGNSRCRTHLIESAQHFVKKPKISPDMKRNLQQIDVESAGIAVKCMNRLHKRFWALFNKGKSRQVAITAITREFVGFIWAMMTPAESQIIAQI